MFEGKIFKEKCCLSSMFYTHMDKKQFIRNVQQLVNYPIISNKVIPKKGLLVM